MKVSLISLLALASSSSTWAKDSVSTGLNRRLHPDPDSMYSQSSSTKSGKSAGCDTSGPGQAAIKALLFGKVATFICQAFGVTMEDGSCGIPADGTWLAAANVSFRYGGLLDVSKHDTDGNEYLGIVEIIAALDVYFDGVCTESLVNAWTDVSRVLEGQSPDLLGPVSYRRGTGSAILCDTADPASVLVRLLIVGLLAREVAVTYGDVEVEAIPVHFGNGIWGCIALGSPAVGTLNQLFGSSLLDETYDVDGNEEFDPLEISLALGNFFRDKCVDENTLSLLVGVREKYLDSRFM